MYTSSCHGSIGRNKQMRNISRIHAYYHDERNRTILVKKSCIALLNKVTVSVIYELTTALHNDGSLTSMQKIYK